MQMKRDGIVEACNAALQACGGQARGAHSKHHHAPAGDADQAAMPTEASWQGMALRMRAMLPWATQTAEPEQAQGERARVLRQRDEALQQLGPAPAPPQAPRGLYLYGSVGSGKSMLMDLFYQQVRRQELVPLCRRLHFNAAMLEVNAKLHAQEQALRARQQRAASAQAAEAMMLETADADLAGPGAPASRPPAQPHPDIDCERREQADVELPETSAVLSRGGAGQAASGQRPVFVPDPAGPAGSLAVVDASAEGGPLPAPPTLAGQALSDLQALRNKDARQALLAARRRLRMPARTSVDPAVLAQSNAEQMKRAARALMHASDDSWQQDDAADWGQWQPQAGVLCFDELQVCAASMIFLPAQIGSCSHHVKMIGCKHVAYLPYGGQSVWCTGERTCS